jgi:hypothetical protein
MAYTLASTEKAPVLGADGQPITTASIAATFPLVGTCAVLRDDGLGFIECVGTSPGSQEFGLTVQATGASAIHTVVVTVPPFDWTLGTPVPK